MGHELRGDDAAGVTVARALQTLIATSDRADRSSAVLVIDAGPVPENHTGVLRRFRPDLVLLIDAAQMDGSPGTVRWVAWQNTSGFSASTHTLPPYILADYLTAELGGEIVLIGIQPADTSIGGPLSPAVQASIDELVGGLVQVLGF